MSNDDPRSLNPTFVADLNERLHLVRDEELRRGFVELFARAQQLIDNDGINLVVLTARRVACTYQLLTSLGMPQLRDCLVVSDRFFDTNPRLDWPSRRALILDDSIVVGTTLRALTVRLRDLVGRVDAIHSLALCLDRDQCAEYLLDSISAETLYVRSREEVQAFSEDLVKTLFDNQIPFFSDFPVTRPREIASEDLDRILATTDWDIADVTAPLFADSTRRALSLIPTDATYERVAERLPAEVSIVVDGFKVRLYVADEGQQYRLVAVPLGLIAPSTPRDLDRALEAVSACATRSRRREVLNRICSHWRPEAKHRLVQLYLSSCVLADVWPLLTGSAECITSDAVDRLQADIYFGPSSAAVLRAFERIVSRHETDPVTAAEPALAPALLEPPPSDLLQYSDLRSLLLENRDLIANEGTPARPGERELSRIGFVFAHAICSFFGFISREYELKERAIIRNLKSVEKFDRKFGALSDAGEPGSCWGGDDEDGRVIRKGLTLRELSIGLTPSSVGAGRWARSLVSLGIDAGNDLGILVPQTRYSEVRDLAFRSYRMGETAHLADRPLREAFLDNTLDLLTQEAVDQPIAPDVVPIDSWRAELSGAIAGEAHEPDPDLWLEELRSRVSLVFPGRLESHVEGRIDSVTDEFVEATIIDEEGDRVRARLSPSQLPRTQLAGARPGTLFTWTMYSEEVNGFGRLTSSVKLYPLPELDLAQIKRAERALSQLADSSD